MTKPPANSRFVQIEMGHYHGLALGVDGGIYSWGMNSDGALGNGDTADQWKPVRVKTPTGVRFTQISTDRKFSLALADNGQVYSWGYNEVGQLGNGDTSGATNPLPAPISRGEIPADVKIIQISAGENHSIALGSNHKMYAWGVNFYGQLGNDPPVLTQEFSPVEVHLGAIPATVEITQVSAGNGYSLAIGSDHRTYAWGVNGAGQLGNGTIAPNGNWTGPYQTTPQPIHQGDIPAGVYLTEVSAGDGFILAIGSDHLAYSWGWNIDGQLGNGDNNPSGRVNQALPGRVVGLGPVLQVSAGYGLGLAIGTDHKAYSWGDGRQGQLGRSSTPMGTTANPGQVWTISDVSYVSAGKDTAISLSTSEDNFDSWGTNFHGNLATAAPNPTQCSPVRAIPITVLITGVSFDNTPVLSHTTDAADNWQVVVPPHAPGKVDVKVYWSNGNANQLPIVLHYEYLSIFSVQFNNGGAPGSAPIAQSVTSGDPIAWPETPTWDKHWFIGWFTDAGQPWDFADGVSSNMTLTARWEAYDFSLIPSSGPSSGGASIDIKTPAPPQSITYADLAAGKQSTLAIGSDGNLYAWGSNEHGALGIDEADTFASGQPHRVHLPEGVKILQVSNGNQHALAIGSDHHVYAWGANNAGQLGNGNTADSKIPVDLTASNKLPNNVIEVLAGNQYSLALTQDGHTWAWGSNASGSLTIASNAGSNTPNPNPVDITAAGRLPETVVGLGSGYDHALAVTSNNHVLSWGTNAQGQLATSTNLGNSNAQPIPVDITDQGALPQGKIIQVSAGNQHSLALTNDGHVYAWGSNTRGQLGDPTQAGGPQPVDLTAKSLLPNTVVQIQASNQYSVALTSNQHTYTWGANGDGTLGNANLTDTNQPNDITTAGQFADVRTLSSGFDHVAATTTNAETYTWGANDSGQLGRGNLDSSKHSQPAAVTTQQVLTVIGLTMGSTRVPIDPIWNSSRNVWSTTSVPNPPGPVDSAVHWTLGSYEQPDYILPYTYHYTLPSAGSIPLQRMSAGLVFTLVASMSLAYASTKLRQSKKQLHRNKDS
ncbi:InlB B-repeat-containing protein [Bombiscardovia apis]|uniref:RCC1 domain-containing protein n=1 Tax=Bombiscardovia apis TaxID=2932182 RepID=UPI002F409A0F